MKKNIALFLIVVLSTLKGTQLFCQNGGLKIPNFSVHSPDVTNIGVYGEYPVDLSTGVPDINIPLYTAKGIHLTSSISLAYHAAGVKVDQEASFVGLGWILNTGGVVTRMVRGKEDEGSYGFKEMGATLPTYNAIDDLSGAGTTGTSTYLKDLFVKDLEPDLFTVSVNGLYAEFCLNNSGQFVSINHEPLSYSVDFLEDLIIIRDKEGTIYRFGKSLDGTPAYETSFLTFDNVNTSTPFPGDPVSGGATNPSAWYLTEIISADLSDTISFKYRDVAYNDYRTTSVTRYMPKSENATDAMGISFNGTIISGLQTSMNNQKVPYKIIFKNGSVEFTTLRDRLDLLGNPNAALDKARINGINIYNNTGSLLKKILFDNASHFNRIGNGANLNPALVIPEYKKKSLKLDGVKFYDKNNQMINEYKFEYDATPLPPRNTTSQDYWGYYNGKSNSTLIPEVFAKYENGLPVYVGDNRRSDFNYMKAGILNKIIYPTGGYTTYEYEPNYYLRSYQQQNQQEVTKTAKAYAVNKLPTCDPEFLTNVPANNVVDFTISENLSSGNANLYVYFTDYKVTSGVSMTVRVRDLDGSDSYYFEHNPTNKSQNKSQSINIYLYQGHTYRIEANTNGVTGSNYSPCNSPYIEVGITYQHWQTTPVNQITPEQAGGLRVKGITNYGADNTLLTRKEYEYGNTDYSVGIGKLITEPGKNYYFYPKLYHTYTTTEDLVPMLWFTSESQIGLGMNHGCPVWYDKVIEKQVDPVSGLTNGKSEYFYSPVVGDYEPMSSVKFPYAFINYPTWKAPNLLKQIHYKFEGGSYTPIREISNTFKVIPEDRIKILKIIDFEPDIWHSFLSGPVPVYSGDNPERFYYYNYYVSRGRYLLEKETIKEYSSNGEVMETSKSISYNAKFDISKEVFTDSKMLQAESRYKYTADLDYTDLISKNIFSLPVQQERLLNNQVSGGSILKYNNFGAVIEKYNFAASTTVAPIDYINAASVPSYYEKKQQLTYDLVKKLVKEVVDEHGINTVYIWSYNGQYPIAEIRNADYATVEAVLGSDNINDNTNAVLTNAAVNSFLSPLRSDSRLQMAMVTTYTFDPLLGVTTITDPKGVVSYYEYDGFGRLKLIKDQNGKILKQFDYQYKQTN